MAHARHASKCQLNSLRLFSGKSEQWIWHKTDARPHTRKLYCSLLAYYWTSANELCFDLNEVDDYFTICHCEIRSLVSAPQRTKSWPHRVSLHTFYSNWKMFMNDFVAASFRTPIITVRVLRTLESIRCARILIIRQQFHSHCWVMIDRRNRLIELTLIFVPAEFVSHFFLSIKRRNSNIIIIAVKGRFHDNSKVWMGNCLSSSVKRLSSHNGIIENKSHPVRSNASFSFCAAALFGECAVNYVWTLMKHNLCVTHQFNRNLIESR